MADSPIELLTRMVRLVRRSLPGVDGCGITVMHCGEPVSVAGSSDLAALNDELQYTAHLGPCLEALHEGYAVESADLATEPRWGRYSAAALRCGIRSVLALPMDTATGGRGALNLYSGSPRGIGEEARRSGADFAALTAGVVEATARLEAAPGAALRLKTALDRRFDVERAVGTLMAKHECAREDAFGILLHTSRQRGEDLYTTAAWLVGTETPCEGR